MGSDREYGRAVGAEEVLGLGARAGRAERPCPDPPLLEDVLVDQVAEVPAQQAPQVLGQEVGDAVADVGAARAEQLEALGAREEEAGEPELQGGFGGTDSHLG